MRCLSLQPGGQLTGSEARGGPEEVRRIRFEVPETSEGVQPRAGDLELAGGVDGAGGQVERIKPATPEGRGGTGRAGEHGEGGNALLTATLMPIQLVEGEGIAPGVGPGEGHGQERP